MKKESRIEDDYDLLECKDCLNRVTCLVKGQERSKELWCAISRWETVNRRNKGIRTYYT